MSGKVDIIVVVDVDDLVICQQREGGHGLIRWGSGVEVHDTGPKKGIVQRGVSHLTQQEGRGANPRPI